MADRTPWYSARDHKPVRVGEYEFSFDRGCLVYKFVWDGECWRDDSGMEISVLPGDRWRGLTEEHRG